MIIEISTDNQKYLQLMNQSVDNILVTGKAGTGKSTLLSQYVQTFGQENLAVLAPTGIAALNVGGLTIHKFFGFAPHVTLQKVTQGKFEPDKDQKQVFKKLEVIVIDEISMVRADLLDCVDMFLRMYGPNKAQAFGGVKMIFVGDMYQLPPVVKNAEKEVFMGGIYSSPYFFSAFVMADCPLKLIKLTRVYRQQDPRFISLLSNIRTNDISNEDLRQLNQCYKPQNESSSWVTEPPINLVTTNKIADKINFDRLQAIKGTLYSYTAEISGEFSKTYYPTVEYLDYKVGAQIMLLNNDSEGRWVNGSIATITSVGGQEKECVTARLQDSGEMCVITPYKWEIYKYLFNNGRVTTEEVGSFKQLPFRLAWAITIHKSQSKTFDRVLINMGSRGAFAYGQTYVALSRCRSFEGIELTVPIRRKDITVDPKIVSFMASLEERYDKVTNSF
ncbi:MAG: AAA family ATPase [Proteobacteria bacterium]|nr:AAA family ATPase [Pseudomonadota bacterium]